MDPNATLRLLLEAVRDQNREQAVQACLDLDAWLRSGGFMPDPRKVGPCRHDLNATEHKERQRHAR